MAPIVITGKKLLREFCVFLSCILVAEGINVYAILAYDRPWIELISMIGFVLVFALVMYLIIWIPRLLVRFFRRGFNNNTKHIKVKCQHVEIS